MGTRLCGVITLFLLASGMTTPAAGQWNRVAAEDSVIRAALDYLTQDRSGYVILDSVPSWYDPEPIRGKSGRPIPPPDSIMAQVIADYRAVNGVRRPLATGRRGARAVVVSDSVLKTLRTANPAKGAYWSEFSKRFEGRAAIFRLSRPGFSADRRTALLDVVSDCGIRCGSRAVMVLVNSGEGWKFDRFLLYLVS